MSTPRLFAVALTTLTLVLGLAACGASPNPGDSPSPSPSVTPTIPDGGISLVEAGVEHGPAGFSVPDGLVVEQVIDQSNVVTLVMTVEQGRILYDYLVQNLAGMGYVIEGQSPDSIYFTAPGWEGAYTEADDIAGLTLRSNPGSFETPGG